VRIYVVRRIDDVTAQVRAAADAAGDELARWAAVDRKTKELIAEGEKQPATRCSVASFYEGREFRLYHRTEIRDVRIVYAPARAIGEFGGEVDNWMWPRHTGDFTLLRAYVGKDGAPADHHEDNVPFEPEHHLRVSRRGVADGDLVMVMGYPGRTERYLSSVALEDRATFFFPTRLDLYRRVIALLEAESASDPARALRLSSMIKSLANREKNAEGMVVGLARNRTLERRRAEEAAFRQWVAADPERAERHDGVLESVQALDLERRATQRRDFVAGEISRLPELLSAALTIVRFASERAKPDLERDAGFQDRDLPRLQAAQKNLAKTLDVEVEQKLMALLLAEAATLPPGQRIAALEPLVAEGGQRKLASIYGATKLRDESARLALLGAGAGIAEERDPLIVLARALEAELARLREESRRRAGRELLIGPRWISAQQEWRGGAFYPDANGTLRVSIASVRGYSPRDGVQNVPFTTLTGLLAKVTGEDPFAVPPQVRAAADGEPGRFVHQALADVPVCFLSDADTTGGNSGSPVVDGKGELVGINFDRVFENVAGDFGYSPERSRNISVDVRFILWHLEHVAPAPALLEELGVPAG
jgi:hypothetical protein